MIQKASPSGIDYQAIRDEADRTGRSPEDLKIEAKLAASAAEVKDEDPIAPITPIVRQKPVDKKTCNLLYGVQGIDGFPSNEVESYRPNSLTSVISAIRERFRRVQGIDGFLTNEVQDFRYGFERLMATIWGYLGLK